MRLLCCLIVLAAQAAKGLVGVVWEGLKWIGTQGGKPTLATLEAALCHGGCSPRTIGVYMRSVDRLMSWGEATGTCVTTPEGISDYLASSTASGAQFGTLRLHLAAARKIFDKALGMAATDGLHYPPPPAPVQSVSDKVLAALFAAAEITRERLLLLLLNHCGLRPGQIAGILWTDVDLDAARLFVHGKARRWSEPIRLPPPIVWVFRRLLRQEPQTAYVFGSPRSPDRPVSVRTIQTNLARIASRCGVTATCTSVRRARSALQAGIASAGSETTADPLVTVLVPTPVSESQIPAFGPQTRSSNRAPCRCGRRVSRRDRDRRSLRTRRQCRSKASRRRSRPDKRRLRALRAPPSAP